MQTGGQGSGGNGSTLKGQNSMMGTGTLNNGSKPVKPSQVLLPKLEGDMKSKPMKDLEKELD